MATNGYNTKIVLAAWRASGLPGAEAEFVFHPGRKWRFDFAWEGPLIAVEVQGGVWGSGARCQVCGQSKGGRHTRGAALKLEWEKLNHAAVMGWRVLYCEPSEVCSAGFVGMLKAALLQAG